MKYLYLFIVLLLVNPITECKQNYTYSVQDVETISVSGDKNTNEPNKIELSGNVSSNSGNMQIRFNKKQSIYIHIPKLSNNQYLRLVNIRF